MDAQKSFSRSRRPFAMLPGTVTVRPLLLKPQWMHGFSVRLLALLEVFWRGHIFCEASYLSPTNRSFRGAPPNGLGNKLGDCGLRDQPYGCRISSGAMPDRQH